MRLTAIAILSTSLFMGAVASVSASQLVYKPINPSFGGDPQNGNWLLSQANAQSKSSDSSSTPGFSIDFPNFGNVTQPTANPSTLPNVNNNTNSGGTTSGTTTPQ